MNEITQDVAHNRARQSMDEHGVLTKAQVMEILGITNQTFYRYRREYPSFKTFRTGRYTKMRRLTLERFLVDLEERQSA